MKFIIEREQLLKPLQQVSGSLSGRPRLPILGNLLLQVNKNNLLLTRTDLEVEMITKITLSQSYEDGSITVPIHKFFNIWRELPNYAKIKILLEENRLFIYAGRSRFSLSTLPASDFPTINDWQTQVEFTLPQIILKRLIEATQFSMACQDVRYYLNGMLFETKGQELRTVTTDGHRLALYSLNMNSDLPTSSVIVPRKGVMELMRLLDNRDKTLKLQIGSNNIRFHMGDIIFTSKLLDGRFPDYQSVLPKNPDKALTANCNKLKQAFSRAAILSNEKFCGVRLHINENQLRITANNSEQEESEEIVDVNYLSPMIEISFNVNYILDVLNALKCEQVRFLLTDENSSVQIEDAVNKAAIYIVMPMRL